MNSSGHLPVSESAARRVRKSKTQRKTRARSRNGSAAPAQKVREPAPVGSLTRTKALLLAALRVWELKHRIGE
jgi:hypothetical protein